MDPETEKAPAPVATATQLPAVQRKIKASDLADFRITSSTTPEPLGTPGNANDGNGHGHVQKFKAVDVEIASTPASTSEKDRGLVDFNSAATGGQQIGTVRFVCLSISLCIGLFLSFLDGSITSTALYSIGVDFDALTSVTWVALAYTLADVGFATVFTAIADVVGRFNAYLLAQTIFFAFSIACGFANSLTQLIVFRVLQGVGGSGLYSLAMVIWPEMSTLALKKWIGAFVGIVVAAAGVAGPLVGGVITNDVSWRWIFWINPPILVVSTVLFVAAWPRGVTIREHERVGFRTLDYKGVMLLAAGCVLPVLAFQEVGERQGNFNQGLFIGPLAAGIGSWFLLLGWEFYITKWKPSRWNPIFPPYLLANRRYAANAANSLLIGFCFFIAIYYVPLHLQTVNGRSPLGAGVSLLPMLGSAAFGSFLAGALSSGIDLLCPTIATGSALMALGIGLMSTVSDSVAVPAKLYGFQVLVGLGFGLTVSSSSILANVECELREHAVAQGIVAQARVFGGSMGIAVGTTILGVRIHSQLAATGILSASELHSLYSSSHTLTPAQLAAVRHTYSDSFKVTMWISAIIASVGFLSSLFIYDNSNIPLPNRVVLQEQREDIRVAELRRKKLEERNAAEQKVQPTSSSTPSLPVTDSMDDTAKLDIAV